MGYFSRLMNGYNYSLVQELFIGDRIVLLLKNSNNSPEVLNLRILEVGLKIGVV